MHDTDQFRYEAEAEAYGEAYGETYLESYGESYGETFGAGEYQPAGPGMFGQSREHALAAELLEVTNEAEMDHFLGNVLKTAVSAVRDFARSDTGRAVGGVLKSAAVQALPQLGQIIGATPHPGAAPHLGGHPGATPHPGATAPPAAPHAGGRPSATPDPGRRSSATPDPGRRADAPPRKAAAKKGGKRELGLQTEGLSAEDREYETARAFVRFADETAQRAAEMAGTAPPAVAAQQAATAAAQQHLPGLLRGPGTAGPGAPATGATEGRWIRRGDRIVVIGA